ncbi:MAG: metallophosphoesterase [Thermofilaceae archaeon]
MHKLDNVKQIPEMVVDHGISIVGNALFLEDSGILVIADLHLGYEQALEDAGVFIPAVQYRLIKNFILGALEETGAEELIVLGDVKHEFGSALRQEWSETLDLFSTLKSRSLKLHVVRGNHDNFLIPILKRLEIPLHDPYYIEEGYLFAHGHKELPLDAWSQDIRYTIIAHEHPAIILRDELGVTIKLKCFLRGSIEESVMFVLPASSPLMPGTEVNVPRARFLSPLLKRVDVSSMRVYAVDLNVGIYDFGTVDLLKRLVQGTGSTD